jgi:AcrR family transcriptional regulator
MRQLAELLQVAPMALYPHIANKDDLTDAMIDVVFSEIGLPSGGADWKTAMRERCRFETSWRATVGRSA